MKWIQALEGNDAPWYIRSNDLQAISYILNDSDVTCKFMRLSDMGVKPLKNVNCLKIPGVLCWRVLKSTKIGFPVDYLQHSTHDVVTKTNDHSTVWLVKFDRYYEVFDINKINHLLTISQLYISPPFDYNNLKIASFI